MAELDPEAFVDARVAGQLVGLKPRTLRAYRAAGKGPAYRVVGGRSIRYLVRDLLEWRDLDVVLPVAEVLRRFPNERRG
jgi:hypothetical protein